LKRYHSIFVLISLSFWLVLGCNPTKRVPNGSYLLSKNQVNLDNKVDIDRDQLNSVIKQKPNRKILGILRFHLGVYNLVEPEKAQQVKNKKLQKRIIRNGKRKEKGKTPKPLDFQTGRELIMNIGEAPSILDTIQTKSSVRQISLFLAQKGYFHNSVKDTTIYRKNKAFVNYNIKTGIPYKINEISYSTTDPKIEFYLKEDSKRASILKPGENYDEEKFSKERERITKMLQNLGYFAFIKEFIHYKVDTALGNHRLNIKIEVKNPEIRLPENDSIIEVRHKQYFINRIIVNTAYNPRNQNATFTDTLYYHDFQFIHNKDLKYRPNILAQRIFLKSGDFYQQRNLEETYAKLSDLKSFKFINIQFREDSQDPENNLINCHILLSPIVRQSLDFATEGTNRGGNLGVAGNVVYRSNNPFGGVENLDVRVRGGFEAQQFDQLVTDESNNNLFFFNTKEIGPEVTLTMPKFLFPGIRPEQISKYFTPKTSITAAYNFQERPELTRKLLNVSFGYTWNQKANRTHFLYPMEINVVNIDPKRPLSDFFNRVNNPFIQRSFTPHATIGLRYVYTFNNQSAKKNRDHVFFRGSFEQAGALLRGIFRAADDLGMSWAKRNEFGSYEIARNTPFAQYLKLDADFRYYKIINSKNELVYRIFAGSGMPYGNLNVLPLERSYFGGGSNSIRAWAARSLGPGSFRDTTSFNTLRIGDMSFETNLEYRFDIYKILEGAFFLDAGNIWLASTDKSRPGGNFDPSRFLNQMALGTGFGLRLDFSFFVFRLDLGLKLRDPMIQGESKWVIRHLYNKEWAPENLYLRNTRNYFTNINFGIGYPF
jgi:outer membrane protein assembly factor BamA